MVTVDDCRKAPDSDACKEACTASTGAPTTAPGFSKSVCNTIYQQFCADPANQARPVCACSLPWSSYPGSAALTQFFPNVQEPLCWFAGCKASGYHKDLPSNLCPACVASLNVDVSNATQSGVAGIAQTCSVTTSTGGASTAGSGAGAAAAAPTYQRDAADVAIDDVETAFDHHRVAFLAGGGAVVAVVLLFLLAGK